METKLLSMMKIVLFSIILTCTTHFCYACSTFKDIFNRVCHLWMYIFFGYNYVYNWQKIHVLTDICQNRWINSAMRCRCSHGTASSIRIVNVQHLQIKKIKKSLYWQSRHSVYTHTLNKVPRETKQTVCKFFIHNVQNMFCTFNHWHRNILGLFHIQCR